MKSLFTSLIIMAFLTVPLTGQAAEKSRNEQAKALCSELLNKLDLELMAAESDRIADTGPVVKATTLMTGASFNYQFGKYQRCINRAKRARKMVQPFVTKESLAQARKHQQEMDDF